MKQSLLKISIKISLVFIVFFLPLFGQAASRDPERIFGIDRIRNIFVLPEGDPQVMIASLINMALGFLGILAVIIILWGGFKWMLSGGNDDKVSEAKKTLVSGIIGLMIIIFAWTIATFVITALFQAAGG